MRLTKFLLLLTPFALLLSCEKDEEDSSKDIPIGGLLSLTGNWSSLGITSQEAMILAAQDINQFMEQTGSKYRFSTAVYDTKLDTVLALQAVRDGLNKNIRYWVGPQSSAEAGALSTFANTNELLVVSQGSTAGSLAIAGDGLFRFCPGDAVEGTAMAKTISTSGRNALITIARDDAGNKGLQQSVGSAFTTMGCTVYAIPPYGIVATDFSALLGSLKLKIQEYSASLGAEKTGVYLASFDECRELFKQAIADPVFASVRWYGGDGVVLSNVLLSDPEASAFAAATHFFAPNFGLPQQPHPDLAKLSAAIKSKTGIEPDAFALATYDAMWVIAKTIASFPSHPPNYTTLKDVFYSEASRHYGITGPIQLNAAGDRSSGTYDYWGIVEEGGSYKWKLVGKSF